MYLNEASNEELLRMRVLNMKLLITLGNENYKEEHYKFVKSKLDEIDTEMAKRSLYPFDVDEYLKFLDSVGGRI